MNSKNKNIANELADKADKRALEEFGVILSNLRIPSGKSKELVWQSILEKLEDRPEARIISLSRLMLRVAASIIILVAVGTSIWIWGFGEVSIYAPKGQHISCMLPDSSSIQLNADTRISYNKVLWTIKRKVKISGEALFKVKKGKRFDVVADLATTSVLGTTFDVYARNGKVKVSCLEGRVSVRNNSSNHKVILTAGLHTSTNLTQIAKPSNIVKYDDITWTYGEFYFTNTPFSEVIKEVERQFNVQINCENADNRYYTGYFNNKDLNDALRLICIPMEVNYIINEKSIEIKQIGNK